ncbi:hypothetical protein C9994_10095 [Marivirga lumbricoides]|uniref:AMP-dependent synthetase/ligase domain-containing protein n=1 Tax=Marivirga lumbricoides TaxID=1046115 RepID=A0A2T4DPR6_9BACT|nr:hypothetical protein C9994_10095 [Marivirga lumbricoides]
MRRLFYQFYSLFMIAKYSKYGLNRIMKDLIGLLYYFRCRSFYFFDEKQFWKYQIRQFEKNYNYALKNISFYKENNYPNIQFSKCRSKEEFFKVVQQIPILKKSVLKSNNSLFFSSSNFLAKIHTTSGTSGTPLKLKANILEKAELQMIKNYWFKKINGKLFPKLLILSGYYVPKVNDDIFFKDKWTNDLHLSIYAINAHNRKEIIETLERECPTIIYGYASAVHLLAKVLGESSITNKRGMVAVTTSEILQPHWRKIIEANLVREVFNFYSSQECAHGIFENMDGYMKIHPRMGFIEILDKNEKIASNELGKVVVTGFMRKSMPLIRYEIGDSIESVDYYTTFDSSPMWPEVGEIIGRSEDLVWKADGSRVGYLCFHATKNIEGIKEAQIIQKDYETFECLLSIQNDSDKMLIENYIKKEIEDRLNILIAIKFIYVDFIPRGKNEKFKAVIVDFEPGEK